MAKKHRTRPALKAVDVWRWIVNGVLEISPVRRTPAFILTKGKSVRQRWLRRRRDQIISATAVTYLRLGTFLMPRWIPVKKEWRAEYLKAHGLADRSHGFATFEGQLQELCYQQVDDLDHCQRQQGYILEGYEMPSKRKPVTDDFIALMDQLARVAAITGHIASRKAGVESLKTILESRLRSLRRSLSSLVENAPTLNGDPDEKKRQVLVAALQKMAIESREIACRPVVRRTRRASRSLALAVEHIKGGQRLDLARARIRSALKNLEYPATETESPDRRWIS